jgi:hypothetical protein
MADMRISPSLNHASAGQPFRATQRGPLMSMRKNATALGTAVVACAVVGLTAGLTPAGAAPKPSGATLFLCPDFGKPGY